LAAVREGPDDPAGSRPTVPHQEEPAADRQELSTVQSVDKALMIVEALLREGSALSAREIADRTGINRTTAHRLINALMHRGWIEKDGGSAAYHLSLKFLVLTNVVFQSRNVLDAIRPTLQFLSERSRETVHVGVLDGYEVIHIEKVDSPERVGVSSKIGIRAEPRSTSLGKALLAASSDAVVDGYVEHASARSEDFDADGFRAEIAATRERGYSIDDEEDSIGVRCIGVAVRSGTGEPLFAMSITGPSGRWTLERSSGFSPELIAAAAGLSRQFGWTSDELPLVPRYAAGVAH
jgi:DNA-binding IclR family transcriptional regulator